jgi:thymidylate synthase (FAD)
MQKRIELYGDDIGAVEYINHMGSDLTVVNSARVSFGKEKKQLEQEDKKLINYLIKHKHTSTLEHCSVTFRFKVPLFIRSQHHRHRTWSYNEISRRYTDFNIQFYEPKEFRTQHKSNRQASNESEKINPKVYSQEHQANVDADWLIRHQHKRALKAFDELLNAGVCREQARGVLPQNMYTEYYGTVNLNNLLKFIDLRTHAGAQWEVQQVAKACKEIASHLFPLAVMAYDNNR